MQNDHYHQQVADRIAPTPMRTLKFVRAAILAVACAVVLAVIGVAQAGDREALWKIVHELCVVHEIEIQSPAPCTEVDLTGGEEAGSAILKDISGKTQYLLVPTRRLIGIEDPLVGTPALPNYWRAAWAARRLVSQRAQKELPRNAIGMAINAAGSRSQDQLHIHIDCIRPDVRKAPLDPADEITTEWADLPVDLAGRTYRARRIDGAEPEPDPFVLLAKDAQALGVPMRDETLAVVGESRQDGKDGFILLAAAGGRAHAEDLLDHSCALAAD
jgi:CDP-diacylglycerol pyrophosphatase